MKKTDNLKTLSRGEKSLILDLFGKNDAVLHANSYNALKIKRAYNTNEKETTAKMKALYLRLNVAYMLFSIAMLLITEVAIAANSMNFWQTMLILLSSDIVFAFYIWMIKTPFKNRFLRYAVRVISVVFIAIAVLMLSVYILRLATLLILAMVITIFAYSSIFAQRNGLLRSKIKDMVKYRTYLDNHADDVSLGRDFIINQPNIFALDLEDKYSDVQKEYNKMQAVKEILQLL